LFSNNRKQALCPREHNSVGREWILQYAGAGVPHLFTLRGEFLATKTLDKIKKIKKGREKQPLFH